MARTEPVAVADETASTVPSDGCGRGTEGERRDAGKLTAGKTRAVWTQLTA